MQGVRLELDLSRSIGQSWASAETEAALQRAARSEARLASAETARKAEAVSHAEHHAAEKEALNAAAELRLGEAQDHVARLLSELQEKDAASRAAQQRVLSQLSTERTAFHKALTGMQVNVCVRMCLCVYVCTTRHSQECR